MNIATPSTVVPTGVAGADAQPPTGVETKAIFVPRRGSSRRICRRNDVYPAETASRLTALTGRAHAKPIDLPTIPEVRENPEQASFLGWLERTHTISIHQLISQHLTDNAGAFSQAVDEQPTPNNHEATFEALCRQILQ